MRIRLLLIALLTSFISKGQLPPEQQASVDSIQQVIANADHDSTVINSWMAWDGIIWRVDPAMDYTLNRKIDSLSQVNLDHKISETEREFFLNAQAYALNSFGIYHAIRAEFDQAIKFYVKSIQIKQELGDKEGIAAAFNNIGLIHQEKGELDKAIDYFEKSVEIKKEIDDKYAVAGTYSNIGIIYHNKGDFAQAINYFMKSLKIREEIGDKESIAASVNNIGIIYKDQEQYDEALKYFERALAMRLEIGDPATGASYNNIGSVYEEIGDLDQALENFQKSLEVREQNSDDRGIALTLSNIGMVYQEQGDLEGAMAEYKRSLEIRDRIGDKQGLASVLNRIASIHQETGDHVQAKNYANQALSMAQDVGLALESRNASRVLWKAYRELGNFEQSLDMHELYVSLRDSILSEENQKEVISQKYKYEYEKQAVADSLKSAEEAKIREAQHELEQARQTQQKYVLFGGLALALLVGGFIFYRLRTTSRQKKVIEEQKQKVDEAYDELEEKNKEILDSITYAKRIQSAILPSDSAMKEDLPESFVLYKPKDIVAGDFYWLEKVEGKRSEGEVLVAAADCTGHGVPGAMVSVVCNNGLNRAVREFGLTDPGEVLNKTRDLVIEEFEKSDEEVKDGMDISLVKLSGTSLEYAGANNPLWIVRKGSKEVEEIKANKIPIGKFIIDEKFTTHKVDLKEGDAIYIFSDGFVDQFGGDKGKKFKAPRFKELLLSIQNESMERQRELLDESFESWRGDIEQIDDVCVIGVRF